MKLRVHGQSLRLRLNQRDVAELRESGLLRASVEVPGGPFVYELRCVEGASGLDCRFAEGVLTVTLGRAEAVAWADSAEVGLERKQAGQAHLLVEKDFNCLHRKAGAEQEDADTFPHPRG